MNKKALSDVVVTIMIVLIGIAAVGILWVALKPGIEQNANQAGTQAKCITSGLSLVSPSCNKTSGLAKVDITRSSDTLGSIQMIVVVAGISQAAVTAPDVLGTQAAVIANATIAINKATVEFKVAPKIGDYVCNPVDTEIVTCVA